MSKNMYTFVYIINKNTYISLKCNFSAVNASFLIFRMVDAAAICSSGSSDPTKRSIY